MAENKEYHAKYRDDLYKNELVFEEIPWINAPQLDQNISIQN